MNQQQEKDGWGDSGRGNGTFTHGDHEGLHSFTTGSNGTIYIQNHSGSYNGLEIYDPAKHGERK